LPSKQVPPAGESEVGGVDTEGSNAGVRLPDEQAAPPSRTLTYSRCIVYVRGLEMNCPMCGAVVKSGIRHKCYGMVVG
jgi:hypothetical protein